jgi:hypothetical protein
MIGCGKGTGLAAIFCRIASPVSFPHANWRRWPLGDILRGECAGSIAWSKAKGTAIRQDSWPHAETGKSRKRGPDSRHGHAPHSDDNRAISLFNCKRTVCLTHQLRDHGALDAQKPADWDTSVYNNSWLQLREALPVTDQGDDQWWVLRTALALSAITIAATCATMVCRVA